MASHLRAAQSLDSTVARVEDKAVTIVMGEVTTAAQVLSKLMGDLVTTTHLHA